MTTASRHRSTTRAAPPPDNARTRIVGTRTGPVADALVVAVRIGRLVRAGLRRAAGAVGDVVTVRGWTVLAVGVAGVGLGYGLGWAEGVAVGWAAVVLLAVAALFLAGGHSHRIDLALPHPRVVVGQPADARLSAANPTRHRLLGARVEVPVGAAPAELAIPPLAPGASAEIPFAAPTARRGVYRLGPVRAVRADPVGLIRREHVWPAAERTLWVHPRTVPIPSTSTGFVRDLEGQATRDLTSSDVAFHALREYQPGDDRRYIHWKSTAKQGVHMVREFEQTRRSHLVVALSLAARDYEDDGQFELAVGVAGSLGVRAVRDARTVSVVASGTVPEFAKRTVFTLRTLSTLTPMRLLDDLAGVDRAPNALSLVDLARLAAGRSAGISVAFLVLGTPPTPAQLRAASAVFPLGVEVVAVVCDPGYAPALQRVGELTVLTVGSLEDLQRALARKRAA